MAYGGIIQRCIAYLANELVVNGLANNRAFQRFAVKTSHKIEQVAKLAAQKKQQVAEQMEEISEKIRRDP